MLEGGHSACLIPPMARSHDLRAHPVITPFSSYRGMLRTRTNPVRVCLQLTPGTSSDIVMVRTLSNRLPRKGSVVSTRTLYGGLQVCSGLNSYKSVRGALHVSCCLHVAFLGSVLPSVFWMQEMLGSLVYWHTALKVGAALRDKACAQSAGRSADR